ncbi:MAG TPA: hypothetical protein VKX49_06570 [Bryobacteraceae bacterium]|jgi:RNA polymerase subunit RPABC4/transcription elongation factor Spt4|nr:hypothetical protein [Bryobacteraceae bacterium]
MKFCFNCGRITPGEPLFCSFCGRTYDVKLCSKMHPNGRKVQVCPKCGSRDFTTPQPKLPWWGPLLEFGLRLLPGSLLVIASTLAALLALHELATNPSAIAGLVGPAIALGVLWWAWSQIPDWFRKAIYDLLKRRRDDERRRD